jgi:uncharacterized protein (DUF1015 family)
MHAGAAGSPPTAAVAAAGPFRLEPFRGLALAAHRVGDPASARAFARPYRQVVQRLRRWERDGHVTRDPEPALYLHEYTSGGLTVRGLVGALDVSRRASDPDDRVVLPHEGVHDAQAEELAARMAEMQLNPAPILLVHRGPARARALVHQVMAGAPDREFVDRAERHNRIWSIREPDVLDELAAHLSDSRPLIADGHHRYAAYLRLQEQRPGTSADHGLAMLVDQDDTPLFLGAIHRTLTRTSLADVAAASEGLGELVLTTEPAAMAALGPSTLVVTDGIGCARLELTLPGDHAAVEVLHQHLIPRLPGRKPTVGYHHSAEDTLDRVATGRGVAVLMPAPDFDLVDRIVCDHRLLPEKATSFQPKPSIGVLMRSLLDG